VINAQSCALAETAAGGASQNHPLDQRENGQGGESSAGPGGRTILAA
jgi:hypothetical protein